MSLQQLSRLLDYLPVDDLKALLQQASTQSPEAAAELFKGYLGESAASLEFISSFNARRQKSGASQTQLRGTATPPHQATSNNEMAGDSEVPISSRSGGRGGKKKGNIHTPPPRQVMNTFEGQGQAYRKEDSNGTGPSRAAQQRQTVTPAHQTLAVRTDHVKRTDTPPANRLPPSAAGRLISDPKPKPSHNSAPSTRNSSPAKTAHKVTLTGGTPMSSASKSLADLDAIIKSLEADSSTNASNAERACNCIATRHPLLAAAPNCLACGKVICVKEGFGPCTFCGNEILSLQDREGMVRELKGERAQEKQAMDRAAHKKVEVSRNRSPYPTKTAVPPAGPTPAELARANAAHQSGNTKGLESADMAGLSEAEKAQFHRDRLLNFQAQNAARTTVHDEAADFQTPDVGVSQWVGPMERARLVKQQQKVLREQEWNARPEWEKKRELVSLDVVNGKVVKTFKTTQQKYQAPEDDEDKENGYGEGGFKYDDHLEGAPGGDRGKGTFSHNPLLGALIKPVYTPQFDEQIERKAMRRRVQDGYEDNEDIILDGGVYGTGGSLAGPDHREGADEKANS